MLERAQAVVVLMLVWASLAAHAQVLDCGRIPHCTQCEARKVGSLTKLFCTACSIGYSVTPDERGCFCSPGFWWNEAGGACEACGVGAWCPGGVGDSKGARTQCGSSMTTTTSRARYAEQCVPQPGHGLLVDSVNAGQCAIGSYSYGFARKPCVPCPRTFTTANTGTSSKWKCATPPGYRYADEQAAPCGFGYWKSGVDFSTACTACGTGLTTPTAASASAAECVLAKPGYYLDKTGGTVNGALPCGVGFYSAGGDVSACGTCPNGTTTYQGMSTSAGACLPMEGYSYNATSGQVYPCPVGSYKFSLGPQACSNCGEGLTTNRTAATSYQDCYIPVGWGAALLSYDPLQLKAARCEGGTYGVAAPAYGPRSSDFVCRKCPLHMTTLDSWAALTPSQQANVLNTGVTSCVTTPGYGYTAASDSVTQCAAGSYSTGYTREACASCPTNYASSVGSSTCSRDCALLDLSCALPGGWGAAYVNTGLVRTVTAQKCTAGTYGAAVANLLTASPCMSCGSLLTTADTNPASSSSDREAVLNDSSLKCVTRPGAGLAVLDLVPYQCPAGDYSAGYTRNPCDHCPNGQTSPAGSDSALDCY